MNKPTCVECGAELKWGFAHNQDTCWDCFTKQFLAITNRVANVEKERALLYWMMALVAEKYGYEW